MEIWQNDVTKLQMDTANGVLCLSKYVGFTYISAVLPLAKIIWPVFVFRLNRYFQLNVLRNYNLFNSLFSGWPVMSMWLRPYLHTRPFICTDIALYVLYFKYEERYSSKRIGIWSSLYEYVNWVRYSEGYWTINHTLWQYIIFYLRFSII